MVEATIYQGIDHILTVSAERMQWAVKLVKKYFFLCSTSCKTANSPKAHVTGENVNVGCNMLACIMTIPENVALVMNAMYDENNA